MTTKTLTDVSSIITSDDYNKSHTFVSTIAKRGTISDNYIIIPGTCTITWTDPATGKKSQRLLRLIDGEPSIFADEQSLPVNPSSDEEKKIISRRVKKLHFQDNVYFCSGSEINQLLFLRLADFNKDKKDRNNNTSALYYELKPNEIARENNEKEDEENEAVYRSRKMEIEEAKAYLLVLNNNPSYAKRIEEMSTDEIRQDVRALAKKNPKLFLQGLQTAAMKNKLHIMRAVAHGIVKTDPSGENLQWSDDTLIVQSVGGKNVIDWVAEKATTDANLARLVDDLRDRYNNIRPQSSVPSSFSVNTTLNEEKEEEAIYRKAKDYGIIKHRAVAVVYSPNADWDNEDGLVKFNNMNSFKSRIATDAMFKTEVLNKIIAEEQLIAEKQRLGQK